MGELSDLQKELYSLPEGYISEKTIHGKKYHYFQHIQNGKIQSEYIKKSRLQEYIDRIEHRNQIKAKIKELLSKQKYVKSLSKEAKEFTGYVMMEDTIVASFESGVCVYVDDEKAPLIISITRDIEQFLRLRVIDNSRTNARLLKKALNIKETDDARLSLYAYGAMITDNYWFKAKHSKLKYQDICFDNDIYSDLSLKGEISIFPNKVVLTPELTTTGSFEKGWKRIDGHWYLYKNESKAQLFSELFAFRLCELLNAPTAIYELDDGYIRSPNFAEAYNFTPIIELAGDDDNYEHVLKCLTPLGDEIVKQYLEIIYIDAIINNVDRHNENLGLLRDKNDGHIISMAQNFDNNLSLLGFQNSLNLNPSKEGFIKHFAKFIQSNPDVKTTYKKRNFPVISRLDLKQILEKMPKFDDIDVESVIDFIARRSEYLHHIIHS